LRVGLASLAGSALRARCEMVFGMA
jgi:hypothetical protein